MGGAPAMEEDSGREGFGWFGGAPQVVAGAVVRGRGWSLGWWLTVDSGVAAPKGTKGHRKMKFKDMVYW